MKKIDLGSKIYILVDVLQGVAVDTLASRNYKTAKKYFTKLKKVRNLSEDDIKIFETKIV
ncbi:MAG: hypothetical protein HYY63_03745 [Elusimicrobia bacterium]|nr:hypothetical protein [Elusimicrobiota bacterium]MBI3012718.1 hypothetical protein [Elusimicrobiota bacterium]MBI4217959.1 hypothetical protein [Elusimicrobiota bacterium]